MTVYDNIISNFKEIFNHSKRGGVELSNIDTGSRGQSYKRSTIVIYDCRAVL